MTSSCLLLLPLHPPPSSRLQSTSILTNFDLIKNKKEIMSSPPNLPFVSMSQVQPYHHELGRHRMNSAPPSLPSRYNPYPSPPSHFSPTPPTQIDINPHKCKPEFEHLLNQNDGEYHHDQFGVPSEGSFFSSVLFPDVSSSPWSSSPEISPEPQGRAPLPHWIMGRDSSPVSVSYPSIPLFHSKCC